MVVRGFSLSPSALRWIRKKRRQIAEKKYRAKPPPKRTAPRRPLVIQTLTPTPIPSGSVGFHVVISAYDRPGDLLRLLRDIRASSLGVRVDVTVEDDATPSGMPAVEQYLDAQQWRMHREPVRRGRAGFARRVYTSFARARERMGPSDLLVLVQDDMRLCTRFFHRLAAVWGGIAGDTKLLVPYRDPRMTGAQWTDIEPRSAGDLDVIGWTDCSFVCDQRTLGAILSQTPAIDPERWRARPSLSSGLGEHLSCLMRDRGVPIYGMRQSLLVHVGTESKMHPGERKKHPILYHDFVDGEHMNRSLLEREPVVASLASIPNREQMLKAVVDSLAPQVDQLNVYLNGYKKVPPFLMSELRTKVVVARSQDHGDRGDAGKFFFVPQTKGYVLTCDDDLLYPPNYAVTMVRKVEQYGRRSIVSVHGSTLPGGFSSYFQDRTVYSCQARVRGDKVVHVVGTGVMAMHASTVKVDPKRDFGTGFMADVHLAVLAKKQDVQMVVIGHGRKWIRNVAPNNTDTLYARYSRRDGPQTKLLRTVYR